MFVTERIGKEILRGANAQLWMRDKDGVEEVDENKEWPFEMRR